MRYLIRWRCRRLHITRGHIASQDGTRHAPYYCWRLGSSDRLNPTLPVRAAKDIVVFRSGPLRSAPLQNPKDFGLGHCYQIPLRCRRSEPWFLAATSPGLY
jgi:hypothetical protein